MVSVATIRAPVRATHHGKNQPDRSLAQNRHHVFRLRIDLLDALQASIYRLDETRLVEGNAGRNFFDAPLDDPIHRAHVLRKPAAGRLISGGDADLLVDRALGVKLPPAVKTFAARNVVKHDHAVAGREARDARADRGHHARGLMPVNARRRAAGCIRSS